MMYTHRYNENILTVNQVSDKLIVGLRTPLEPFKHVEVLLLDGKDFRQYQRILSCTYNDVSYFVEQSGINILIKVLHKSDVLVDAVFAVDVALCIVGILQTVPMDDRDSVMLQILEILRKSKKESIVSEVL